MSRCHQPRKDGFSSVELLLALAIGVVLIAAASVAYGTITRNQSHVGNSVYVTLDSAKLLNFYDLSGTVISTAVAPNYGALAKAEDMRETFLADTLSATAVYCLARADINTFRPHFIPYNPAPYTGTPAGDITLDTNQNFRKHLRNKNLIVDSSFTLGRVYDTSVTNASIFVMGYSSQPNQLEVRALYEVDILRPVSPTTGYYVSVRRYAPPNLTATTLVRTQYYDLYYPPPPTPPTLSSGTVKKDAENFAPVWVSFERSNRADKSEGTTIDIFKAAREKPFYFVWWPDPAAKSLGMLFAVSGTSAFKSTDPRSIYNHMGGRTSFMFTVPVFPAL